MVVLRVGRRLACCGSPCSEAALDGLQALQALDEWLVAGLRRAGVPAPRCLVLLASAAPGEMAALDEATPLPTRYKVLYRYLTRRASKGFGGLEPGVEASGSLVHSFTLGVGGGT